MADAAEEQVEAAGTPPAPRGAEALVRSGRVRPGPGTFEFLNDVNLSVSVSIGRARVTIRDILRLERGSVVSLDKLSGEAVDIRVGDELLAVGEVIVIQDKLRIRVLNLVYPPDHEPETGTDV